MPSTLPYATLPTVGTLSYAALRKDTQPGSSATDLVASSTGRIAFVQIDNTANTGAVYLKIYNVAAASVTVGTTTPWVILFAPGSTKVSINVPKGLNFSSVALSYVVVTTGGTGGNTAPSNAVPILIDTIS